MSCDTVPTAPPTHDTIAPAAPTVDGPFVEVAPNIWLRAEAVLAVIEYPAHTWHLEYVSRVFAAGGRGNDPASWCSPHPAEALRTACRLAEHGEDLRRLRAAGSDGDGR